MSTTSRASTLPVLLLKTKSTPTDAYAESLAEHGFQPIFVPVLDHKPIVANVEHVRVLLKERSFGRDDSAKYGGMIFTSQRAVEGFAQVVSDIDGLASNVSGEVGQAVAQTSAPSGPSAGTNLPVTLYSPFPIYVVGPATSGTLLSLLDACARAPTSILKPLRCQVFGASTGNGESLAGYILEHYNELPGVKLPLLFLVGEQRRDVIPRSLMFPSLPPAKQIKVDELVVYETVIMSSFPQEFAQRINMIDSHPEVNTAVVVVFSPSGCEAMLTCLGLIDQHNQLTRKGRQHGEDCQEIDRARGETQYVITTIGPTTKNYLRSEFGIAPDVCARRPSPAGVVEGILEFLRLRGLPEV